MKATRCAAGHTLLVAVLDSKSPEAREHAAAVVSALARTQGGNKRAIYNRGIKPLVASCQIRRPRYAEACGMCLMARVTGRMVCATQPEGGLTHYNCPLSLTAHPMTPLSECVCSPSGIYDKQTSSAIPALIAMLQFDDVETRGFAAACLLCLCKDSGAHGAIWSRRGLLTTLSYHPTSG